MTANKKLFCFGYGYTSDYLGHELSQRGDGAWTLAGTTRDPEKRRALRARGVQAHIFDEENPMPGEGRFAKGDRSQREVIIPAHGRRGFQSIVDSDSV